MIEQGISNAGPRPKGFIIEPPTEAEEAADAVGVAADNMGRADQE